MFFLFSLIAFKDCPIVGLVCVVIVRSGRLACLYVSAYIYMYAFVFVLSFVICGVVSSSIFSICLKKKK